MKQSYFRTTIMGVLLFFVSQTGIAQVFAVDKNTKLKYTGIEDKEKIKLIITDIKYSNGGASFSYSDNYSYEKKGKVIISKENINMAESVSTSPMGIIDRSEKFAYNSSGIWLSKNKFDSVVSHNVYIEHSTAEDSGVLKPWKLIYEAQKIKQPVTINGKKKLVDAYKLECVINGKENLSAKLTFVIMNDSNMPILLYSKSEIWGNYTKNKFVVYEVKLDTVTNPIKSKKW